MPTFSASSVSKLSTCHIDLKILFDEVIKTLDCTILCGHRGEEEQNKAFEAGNSKLKWPDGNHNATPSLAVDAAPFPYDPKNLRQIYYFVGFVFATAINLREQGCMKHAIRLGADFNKNNDVNDDKFIDAFHFELIT